MKKIAAVVAGVALVAPLALATPAQAATKYKRGTTFSAGSLVNAGMPETATMNVTRNGKRVATGVAAYKARKKGTYRMAVTYRPMEWSVSNQQCRVVSETVTANRTVVDGDWLEGQIDTTYALSCTADVEDYRWLKTRVAFTSTVSETDYVFDPVGTPAEASNTYVVGDAYWGGSDVYLNSDIKVTVPAKRIVR